MAQRAALLINCSRDEARQMRDNARAQRRTLSGYVLNIVWRTVELQEQMYANFARAREMNSGARPRPRTTVLVRCSNDEAKRIRKAARVRAMTISEYVLRSLHRAWDVAQTLPEIVPHAPPQETR
jgi:uncharacterized protein (DUF1778 family)